jgi:transposase
VQVLAVVGEGRRGRIAAREVACQVRRQVKGLDETSDVVGRRTLEIDPENRRAPDPRKALGPALATTLSGELVYKDFSNGRQVGSYCGLAPSPWKSGGIDREQGISKAGNARVRQKSIELAWLWRRHQPNSALSLEFERRVLNAGKRARRIAIVAPARKLVVALWRYLQTGLVPTGAMMKA